jgi:hypothetical protein
VRDDDQRLAGGIQVKEQAADLVARAGVDRAGRLVGEQQRRPVDERPRDGHALPLATGKPGRVGVPAVGDPQRVEQFVRTLPGIPGLGPGELRGQQHVVNDRHVVEQVEELEDHADLAAAEACRARFAEHVHPFVADADRPARRLVHPGDEVEQRGLARTGRSHDGHRLAGLDPQAHVIDGGRGRTVVALEDVL